MRLFERCRPDKTDADKQLHGRILGEASVYMFTKEGVRYVEDELPREIGRALEIEVAKTGDIFSVRVRDMPGSTAEDLLQ